MEELDVEPALTLIPEVNSDKRQLCFEWGPGEMLVCETVYGYSGPAKKLPAAEFMDPSAASFSNNIKKIFYKYF